MLWCSPSHSRLSPRPTLTRSSSGTVKNPRAAVPPAAVACVACCNSVPSVPNVGLCYKYHSAATDGEGTNDVSCSHSSRSGIIKRLSNTASRDLPLSCNCCSSTTAVVGQTCVFFRTWNTLGRARTRLGIPCGVLFRTGNRHNYTERDSRSLKGCDDSYSLNSKCEPFSD